MATAPATLYCTPQDLYEQGSAEGVQLRLDDQNQASGQQVAVTADAAINAASISVAALQYGLLRGTRLVFSDAQMASPVEVTLSAVAAVGATSLTVVPLTVAVTNGAIALDNGVNVWLGGLLAKACYYATDRCNTYLCNRYETAALATSYTVNQFAITIALKWLTTRLFRAAPEQIVDAYKEVMDELEKIKDSKLNLNLATRTSGTPFLSNVTVDIGYTIRKIRVEQAISEQTPTQYPQATDWNSYMLFEY